MPKMIIEKRSSAIASVSRNIFSEVSMRDPSSARAPIAKAISVGIGTAQPASPGPPKLKKV